MSTWYTADLHLNHERIIELCNRPFDSVDEMNDALIANWNERVQPEDTVWVLGDVALGKLDETLQLVTQLNGWKLLVPGNHDRCWVGNKKMRDKDVKRYEDVGFVIHPSIVRLANGWRLSHLPYDGDSHDDEERFAAYRPKRESDDEILIHGHTHSREKIRGNQIHVGVDAWDYRPVHHDEIADLIS